MSLRITVEYRYRYHERAADGKFKWQEDKCNKFSSATRCFE